MDIEEQTEKRRTRLVLMIAAGAFVGFWVGTDTSEQPERMVTAPESWRCSTTAPFSVLSTSGTELTGTVELGFGHRQVVRVCLPDLKIPETNLEEADEVVRELTVGRPAFVGTRDSVRDADGAWIEDVLVDPPDRSGWTWLASYLVERGLAARTSRRGKPCSER